MRTSLLLLVGSFLLLYGTLSLIPTHPPVERSIEAQAGTVIVPTFPSGVGQAIGTSPLNAVTLDQAHTLAWTMQSPSDRTLIFPAGPSGHVGTNPLEANKAIFQGSRAAWAPFQLCRSIAGVERCVNLVDVWPEDREVLFYTQDCKPVYAPEAKSK
jgi:hypothetical protein